MWRLTLQKVHTSAPTFLPGKLLGISVEANPSEGTCIYTHFFRTKTAWNYGTSEVIFAPTLAWGKLVGNSVGVNIFVETRSYSLGRTASISP